MNLISCENCAVVLDKDNLKFSSSDAMYDEDGAVDESIAAYSQKTGWYVPKVGCPVCGEDILDET